MRITAFVVDHLVPASGIVPADRSHGLILVVRAPHVRQILEVSPDRPA